ncbi:MAG: collagenase-like protease, partial [Erysipelotrichaceae bacterium]|nr:collagenase-like protease [Erysipelotrichaceae bacterium]
MSKIELLSPAGDLARLKTAVRYGADAVYIGGKQLSLRSRASNFSLEEIAEGVKFAKQYGARVHVTVNMIPHDED